MQELRGKDDEIVGLLEAASSLAADLKDTVSNASAVLRTAAARPAEDSDDTTGT